MKNITIIAIILSTVLMFSCKEDFLVEDPRDDFFAENLYVDLDGFNNGLNALYSFVRQDRQSQSTTTRASLWQMGTDNAFVNGGSTNIDPFNNYNILDPSNNLVRENFEWLYRIITSANLLISRAEDPAVGWQGGTDELNLVNKNKVIAQARLIRAWCYRHLRYGWGAVPLNTVEISGTTFKNDWERATIAEIYALMEDDLLFARDNLDMREGAGTDTWQVNSAVASTMLAELYLAMEENALAETEALRVINNGEYQLMTSRFGSTAGDPGVPFSDLFNNPTRAMGNMEVIWELNNAYTDIIGSAGVYVKNAWTNHYGRDNILREKDLDSLYTYNGGKGAGRVSVCDSAFNWYEPTDDRYSSYAVKKFYIFPSDASGTTFDTLLHTTMDFGDNPDNLEDFHLWPWVRKWEYNDPFIFENASLSNQYNDQMFMRLAETYLLLAEALMKQGKTNDAADYLNALRARSNASAITGADVDLEFILRERSRELVTEEYRRHTLVRTGTFYERSILYNPRLDASKVNTFNELLPIPQEIIDTNTGAPFMQNDGYN